MPKALAVVVPVVVAIAPSVVALISQTKTFTDLIAQGIAAAALVITNLFPRHDPPPPIAPVAQ
ncbi:MAG: hypothetical protein ACOYBP_09005 [Microbacteriaceae bacterium]